MTIYEIAFDEAAQAGNGKGYCEQVAGEIENLISVYLARAAGDAAPELPDQTVAAWLQDLRTRTNRKEMSASWGANFLMLLIRTIIRAAAGTPALRPLCTALTAACEIEKKRAHWF